MGETLESARKMTEVLFRPGQACEGRAAHRDQLAPIAPMDLVDGALEAVGRVGQRLAELVDDVTQLVELGLEIEDPPDPREAHPVGGELLDALEQRDVTVGVAAATTRGASGFDEALAFVDAQ